MRNFFWGHEDEIRKIHPISWETICRPKNLGGLGIRNIEHHNKTLFLSQIWKLKQCPTQPWAQVLVNKCGSSPTGKRANSSYTFKCI